MKRVLFLDARNSVRSPMAEASFNHLAGGWVRAYSRGTMPSFKIDPQAVKVMKEVEVIRMIQFGHSPPARPDELSVAPDAQPLLL